LKAVTPGIPSEPITSQGPVFDNWVDTMVDVIGCGVIIDVDVRVDVLTNVGVQVSVSMRGVGVTVYAVVGVNVAVMSIMTVRPGLGLGDCIAGNLELWQLTNITATIR
jgi:hypothetical protein